LCVCAPRAVLGGRCGVGGSGGPLQRWLAKGPAAAGKTRPDERAICVRCIATDFVDDAQELPEQRRCHHRGPLRTLLGSGKIKARKAPILTNTDS
jgi:hypothetical protein